MISKRIKRQWDRCVTYPAEVDIVASTLHPGRLPDDGIIDLFESTTYAVSLILSARTVDLLYECATPGCRDLLKDSVADIER